MYNVPELPKGMKLVPCAVQNDPAHSQYGWLFIPHADGKWVSLCKLPEFSKSIIHYWWEETRENLEQLWNRYG